MAIIKIKKMNEMDDKELDELVGAAETYLRENGEKKLKRELRTKLGMAYKEAGFEDIGDTYLGLKGKS